MKKFEEKLRTLKEKTFKLDWSPGIRFWYDLSTLVNTFRDWVSPEEHQQVVKALGNTTDKLDCAEERVGFLEKTVDQLKSQLEKQQPEIPEVPQFVADWYEGNKHMLELAIFSINADICVKSSKVRSDIEDWFADAENKPIETIFAMKNGYTVAKEKRFYLKNKLTGQRLIRLLEENGGGFLECVTSTDKERMQFTQSEIDSMETGSYEQIEVTE